MNISLRQRAAHGFTLIELLIVVIIIAILAAIAIPQFSNSTADAQEAALDANLATVRSAIELYRVQHSNVFPGANVSTGGNANCTTAGGTAGTGALNTDVATKEQMIMYSNSAGLTCSVTSKDFPYGPYMRAIPAEPIKNSNAIVVINGPMTNPVVGDVGWRYSLTSGQFAVNNLAVDRSGAKTYFAH